MAKFRFKAHVYENNSCVRKLNYRLFSPKVEKHKVYPLVLYLHGSGQSGTNNKSQLDYLVTRWTVPGFQSEHPCFVLAPQCPKDVPWANMGVKSIPFGHYVQDKYSESQEMTLIVALIHDLIIDYQIDSARIYVVGYSMGASGTWDILTRHPDIFAAAMVASGETDVSKAFLLKNIPIWAFCGEKDAVVYPIITKDMTDAVNLFGGNAKFTLMQNIAHNDIGHLAFDYPGVKDWLFRQVKNKVNLN